MSKAEHGKDRSGLITASIARTIMTGGPDAWESLSKALWADDGSEFAQSSFGARAHGHEWEPVGRSMFWDRHPQLEIDESEFVRFSRKGFAKTHEYRRMLGFSPDGVVRNAKDGELLGGIEIKSPTSPDTWREYVECCSRLHLPPAHEDQVYFSLWASGWRRWYFVSHFESEDGPEAPRQYVETVVGQDDLENSGWVNRFRPKLDAFLRFYLDGEKPERDKLAAGGLAALLRA